MGVVSFEAPIQPLSLASEPARETASTSRTRKTPILIVDDHPLFRDGLQALLGGTERFEVVGQAQTSGDAFALTRQLKPEIVLLDISLDNNTVNGLELVHRLRRISPDIKVAILTGYTQSEYLMQALRVGVQAYLLKDMPSSALIAALDQVRNGERVLPNPRHVTLALTELGQIIQERDRAHAGLNEKEIEMLRLAASGHNNKEIGAYEFWSEITVKRKMQGVYRKLGVSSRAQAVAEAIRLGFI